jgi:site-specific recombinase XerC
LLYEDYHFITSYPSSEEAFKTFEETGNIGSIVITRDVNKVMREVSNQLPGKLNITSHSFRIGYITQLWKDSKDIEFVKQTMGHRNLYTTSAYVNQLSDQERQNRINQLE